MITASTMTCPCCQFTVYTLSFWKKIDGHYFHICEECLKTELTPEQSMRVAFFYGQFDIKEKLDAWIHEVKNVKTYRGKVSYE